MDTNFCNLLNIWDKVFGTFQNESTDIEIKYGITRQMSSGNFMDVYFGEIIALAKDVSKAPGIKNKLKYIFMPQGWHHSEEHQTAKIVRQLFEKITNAECSLKRAFHRKNLKLRWLTKEK